MGWRRRLGGVGGRQREREVGRGGNALGCATAKLRAVGTLQHKDTHKRPSSAGVGVQSQSKLGE